MHSDPQQPAAQGRAAHPHATPAGHRQGNQPQGPGDLPAGHVDDARPLRSFSAEDLVILIGWQFASLVSAGYDPRPIYARLAGEHMEALREATIRAEQAPAALRNLMGGVE